MKTARTLAAGVRRYTVRAAGLQLPNSGSLLEYVWRGLQANSGGGTAVHCPSSGRKIGYERLKQASENFAGWLGENCTGSLALLLPNSPESVVSALAALEAGVPLAALNPESTLDELTRSLQQVRSPWIVTKSSLVHTALEAVKAVEAATRQEYPIKVISVDDEMVFSGVLQLVDLTDNPCSSRQSRRSGTALVSQAWREHGPETILASCESILASCLQSASPHLHPGARLATNVPFFTRYGLSQGLLAGLSAGAELVILPQKGDINGLLHQYQPSVASLVPSSLYSVHSSPSSLKAVTVPGLLSKQTCQNLSPSLADRLVQHYGPPDGPVVFSETAAKDCSRLGQPVPGTEVKVTAGGGEVGVMSEGEISVRGPQFGTADSWISTGDTGYYDPEDRLVQHYGPPDGPVVFSETAAKDCSRLGQPVPGTEVKVTAGGGEVGVMSEGEISVRGPQFGTADSWISTGDTGYYDPEGTFYLTRAGGLTVDGMAVWPGELEAVLRNHEGVVAAAVFGAGSSVVAVIVPADPYNPPATSDIKLWMKSRTSPHKKVNDILFTSSLPTTQEGQIDRALLASRYVHPMEYAAVSSV